MSLKGKILMCGKTDVGLVRDHNEDSISCNESIALAVLADGMGGHRGGEMASAITVNTILETVTEKLKTLKPNDTNNDTNGEENYRTESLIVHEAVTLANKKVHDSSEKNAQYRGMGTTVVVTLFYDNQFTVAHVGDSRLYRLRNYELVQITRDHSLIQELLDRGYYTPEQAKSSLNKNLVTRAIGIDENVEIDIHEDSAQENDLYLLCSDGVTDMLDDNLIKLTMLEHENDLEKAAAEIIQLANKHGGKDNASAILIKPVKSFPAKNNLLSQFFDVLS